MDIACGELERPKNFLFLSLLPVLVILFQQRFEFPGGVSAGELL